MISGVISVFLGVSDLESFHLAFWSCVIFGNRGNK